MESSEREREGFYFESTDKPNRILMMKFIKNASNGLHEYTRKVKKKNLGHIAAHTNFSTSISFSFE